MSALATIAQLAALIGEDTAGELARAFSGQLLCLPMDPAEEPRLEAAIGPIAAACLCEELGGHTIAFPAAPARASCPAPATAAPAIAAAPAPAFRAAGKSAKTGSVVLDEIAEVIGEEAALKLAEEFVGERLYIPRSPETDPRIVEAIGNELAGRLCDTFFRITISIPIRLVNARRVAEMVRQGKSKREIGRALRITERQVYRILEGLRTA